MLRYKYTAKIRIVFSAPDVVRYFISDFNSSRLGAKSVTFEKITQSTVDAIIFLLAHGFRLISKHPGGGGLLRVRRDAE